MSCPSPAQWQLSGWEGEMGFPPDPWTYLDPPGSPAGAGVYQTSLALVWFWHCLTLVLKGLHAPAQCQIKAAPAVLIHRWIQVKALD